MPVKVLILKPSSLGDIIHALPVLRLIKLQRPDWEVHWWISKPFAPVLEMDRDIKALHHFHRHDWGAPRGWTRGVMQMRRLRDERFDLVIDLQGLARSAIFGWVAGGAFTVGLHQHRDGIAGFYDVAVERPGAEVHAVDWNRAVLPVLGLAEEGEFDWLPARPWLQTKLVDQGYDPDYQWIVLCPGARWASKRWPIESFASLIDKLYSPNKRFAVIGGKEDQRLAEKLADHPHCLDLTGRTTLPELIEWLRVSTVLVTNDTGPMHIAAALKKPVVALFGSTHPGRTGPYQTSGRVLQTDNLDCVPCLARDCVREVERECLRQITPTAVAAAVAACE